MFDVDYLIMYGFQPSFKCCTHFSLISVFVKHVLYALIPSTTTTSYCCLKTNTLVLNIFRRK